MNGKRAIHISRVLRKAEAEIVGERFWERGYFVLAVARREHYGEYTPNEERQERRLAWMRLGLYALPMWRRIKRGRVSDPDQPLRAAHELKPPALPGATAKRY